MTTEYDINENVRAVLADLDEWTYSKPNLMYLSGDYMRVELDMSQMFGDGKADMIDFLIRRNWRPEDLDTTKDIATMSGKAYDPD